MPPQPLDCPRPLRRRGRLPLDTNIADRQQRPIALGRKLDIRRQRGMEDGGTLAADLLTIFQGSRLQHLGADYLTTIVPDLIVGSVDPLRLTPAAYAAKQHQVA